MVKLNDKARLSSIVEEIGILRRAENTHIIQLLDAFESNDHYYLITEYAPNKDLLSFINERSKLSEWSAAWLIKQILEALQYLHGTLNVVHWYFLY